MLPSPDITQWPALKLRGLTLSPPLLVAPMAGITNSAFRRLLAGFGGHGALYTEMLAAKPLLVENFASSPFVRRRPEEGTLIYQLLAPQPDRLPEIVERLRAVEAAGLDLNCGCPAPDARVVAGGAHLFIDPERLRRVLDTLRAAFPGPLTVKVRLGFRADAGWEERFLANLRLFEECGVDAVTLHPRFAEERLKRPVLRDRWAWAAAHTRLPVIANGDITGRQTLEAHPEAFRGVAAVMVGRQAIAQPWLCSRWNQPDWRPADPAAPWELLRDYLEEDFSPKKAFLRLRDFTFWYARNFRFGHALHAGAQHAPDIPALRTRALAFLRAEPAWSRHLSFSGL
ncbi:MAG: tRNA-dihydrouridine synthase family protein [Lentisphaeria bacterium]